MTIAVESLAGPQRRAFELIREVAAEKSLQPHLVGGPVRDLLLGRSAIDLDFTLEKGSSDLARGLAERINGRVRSFPQFLTYKVTAEDFPDIDIATARSEKYRQAGALPAVSEGTLADDLLRRDFSINAIAFDVLNGRLHDPAGGQRDLESQTVRVLHDLSFIDDPTRIFRALRLGTRLGFRLEPATEDLMLGAIGSGALATVSKERLWRELFLAFEEERAADVVAALNRAGALDVLFGRREIERDWLERSQRVANANPSLDRQVLFLSAILNGNASPVDMEGSGLSQQRQRVVVQIANEIPRFTDALTEATSERARFKVLKKASPELLAVLPPEQVGKYREFQNFRLALRGNDLDVAPGPHIARALERTREAVFMGEITADEARTFARELAIKYLGKSETG
jgi:tRNA nucleotidyltransferase/poly(A) polymerase